MEAELKRIEERLARLKTAHGLSVKAMVEAQDRAKLMREKALEIKGAHEELEAALFMLRGKETAAYPAMDDNPPVLEDGGADE